jgi:hypothetical protein
LVKFGITNKSLQYICIIIIPYTPLRTPEL